MTGRGTRLACRLALAAATSCLVAPPAAANAGLLNELNAVRTSGCDGRPGVAVPLRENAQLIAAARRARAERDFRETLAASGYRATLSALIHVSGDADPRSVAEIVARKYCAYLVGSAYREIGIHQQGRDTWIVIAAPFSPPAPDASDAVARRVLELVNRVRMQARMCGDARYAVAGLLRPSVILNRAALAHATEMAQHAYLAHEGRDGSTPAERVTRAGYRWRSVGENIASGPTTPEAVVDGWVRSPHHCANLMAPQFTEMGIAYAVNRASEAGIYWTQVFAAPR